MQDSSASMAATRAALSPDDQAPVPSKRLLLAALISGFLPGAGQLLVGKWKRGCLLLSAFFLFSVVHCVLRLPQSIYGTAAGVLANLILAIVAILDAGYSGAPGQPRLRQRWLALLLPLAFLASAAHANWQLRAAAFRVFLDPSRSMSPTIPLGGKMMVDLRRYRDTQPRHGEVIVGMSPASPGIYIVKRMIAVAGDRIEVEGDVVMVNGKKLDEPYVLLNGPLPEVLGRFGPMIVPANKLFLVGDNRHLSLDSRSAEFGLMDVSAVRGRVIYEIPSAGSELPWRASLTRINPQE